MTCRSSCNVSHKDNLFSPGMWFNKCFSPTQCWYYIYYPYWQQMVQTGTRVFQKLALYKKLFQRLLETMYWCNTLNSTACEQYLWSAVENGNGVCQIGFRNLNGETFRATAESVLARLRWDRLENMSGEMMLTPTFSFLPLPLPDPHSVLNLAGTSLARWK